MKNKILTIIFSTLFTLSSSAACKRSEFSSFFNFVAASKKNIKSEKMAKWAFMQEMNIDSEKFEKTLNHVINFHKSNGFYLGEVTNNFITIRLKGLLQVDQTIILDIIFHRENKPYVSDHSLKSYIDNIVNKYSPKINFDIQYDGLGWVPDMATVKFQGDNSMALQIIESFIHDRKQLI